jgi:N12 class adenine-specific DNA methylase
MMAIRDAARALLESLSLGNTAAADGHRAALNAAYDDFLSRHGLLNSPKNSRLFRTDPEAALLLALENYDVDNPEATSKAALFHHLELRRLEDHDAKLDPVTALGVTLNHKGRIDQDFLSRLTGLSWEELWNSLRGHQLFLDPATMATVTAEEYLSGEVREKLRAAIAAAEVDPEYTPNVKALEAVQPVDVAPGDIAAQLGSSWIDTDTVRAFAAHLLGISESRAPQVTHIPLTATWKVSQNIDPRGNVANTKVWGTDRFTAVELIEAGLNLRLPVVYDEVEA